MNLHEVKEQRARVALNHAKKRALPLAFAHIQPFFSQMTHQIRNTMANTPTTTSPPILSLHTVTLARLRRPLQADQGQQDPAGQTCT